MAEPGDFHPAWLGEKPNDMHQLDWERLCEAYWLYTNMYFRHTEVTKQFLHPLNVAYIVGTINRAMTEIVKTKFTCKEFYTSELQQSLADTAYGNSSYANTNNQADRTAIAIDRLTGKFIDQWITDLWVGWQSETRFHEWAIEDNRMKFFPYPIKEDNPTDTQLYTADYLVSSPWAVGYHDFLTRFRQPDCINRQAMNSPEGQNAPTTSLYFFFDKILNPRYEFEADVPIN